MTGSSPSNRENRPSSWVTVTKPVSYIVKGLRQVLKTCLRRSACPPYKYFGRRGYAQAGEQPNRWTIRALYLIWISSEPNMGTPWPVNLRWYKPTLPLIWYRAGIVTVADRRNLFF